ncbi:MAG: MFS transporter [Actinomycetota bacterium]|uniref:MFS transporter n=1 Tax=uncultured Ilumatobacter sp. TaxID=879968 RepID=UPI00374F3644|nr:MFS transporter [Actinomycetota bacterium]
MTEAIDQAVVDRAALQRRTLTSLRMAQVPGQAAVAGMVAVVTLLASDMLGSDRLAGIGSASFTLGAALTMVPLAAFMRRRGRRPGMTAALLIGAAGGAIAATGGQLRFFPLFVVGMILVGAGQASTLQGRYVAADLAEPGHQATAIAAIVWIGALGAVFGPLLTPFEKAAARSIGLDELIGPFVFATVLFLVAAAVVWTRLRPDPLAVSGGIDPTAERTRPIKQVRASIAVIAQSSGARLGFAAMAISQAVMVGVMTMTPPHMKDHDHANLSAFVIAVHILGMYGLAPFVGRAVEHIGRVRSIQIGAVVLGSGTMATVLAGYVPALMFVGLFLLGLGWNIGLIAGSTLLTTSVPAKSKVEVQGTSDLTMSFCGALAAFSSGFIKQSFGFHLLANVAAVLAGCLLVYAWITAARDRAAFNSA